MGQKVHPTGIRLGIVKDHNSVWYADKKTYADNLITDLKVREYVEKKLAGEEASIHGMTHEAGDGEQHEENA